MKKKEHGYRLLLQWAALPVTDRRWGATLAAVALGFGLFVGVAIGPGASGTLAGGVPQVIEVAGLGGAGGGEDEEASGFEETEAEEPLEAEPEASESGIEFEPEEETFEEPEAPSEETSPPATEPKEEDEAEPEAELITLSGVVVHSNPAAGSYTVAEASGAPSAIHATKLPHPGTRVSVPVRTLANGTFAEGGTRKRTGSASKAKLEGIVTYVDADPAAPAYAVSKRGVSVLVKVRPDLTGAPAQLPVLGAFARVGIEIEKLSAAAVEAPPAETPEVPAPEPALPQPLCEGAPLPAPEQLPQLPPAVAALWQTSLDASGVPFTYSDLAGVVIAVCAQEGRLLISADDVREAGADLILTVPAKLATDELEPGDSVLATAEIGTAGELTLKGLASDEHTRGADDPDATQGDLVNHLDE